MHEVRSVSVAGKLDTKDSKGNQRAAGRPRPGGRVAERLVLQLEVFFSDAVSPRPFTSPLKRAV
jgi:hypothetical protein